LSYGKDIQTTDQGTNTCVQHSYKVGSFTALSYQVLSLARMAQRSQEAFIYYHRAIVKDTNEWPGEQIHMLKDVKGPKHRTSCSHVAGMCHLPTLVELSPHVGLCAD
jgi:hypothetical protein